MKKKTVWIWLTAAVSAALLTACGSSNLALMEESVDSAAYDMPMEDGGQIYGKAAGTEYAYAETTAEAAAEEAAWDDTAAGGSMDGEILDEQAVAKKLIRNVDLEVETKEFDVLIDNITSEVAQLGGYVENFSTSKYSGYGARNGSVTARIPSESLDGFLNKISEQSNVTYRNESVQDVTLQYVDLDTHKKALVTERDRLLELMEKAETVADIIEIESRLSEVNYQIESMEAQLRTIDNQVTYSTVYISIYEVELLTPAADKSVWQEISEGFNNNVYRLFAEIEDMGIGFVINLPFILVWVLILAVIVIVLRLLSRMYRKRRSKRLERKRQQQKQETDYEIIPPAGDRQQALQDADEKDGQNGKTV